MMYGHPLNSPNMSSVREYSSLVTHSALRSCSNQFSQVTRFYDEAASFSKGLNPWCSGTSNPWISGNSTERFNEKASTWHTKIDNLFSTNYAAAFSPLSTNVLSVPFTLGMMPSPQGAFGFKAKIGHNGKPIPTSTGSTRGWKLEDPIHHLTRKGKTPKWNTIRQRVWKNQAYYNPNRFSSRNLKRTKLGRAEQRFNLKLNKWESKELHHLPPQREGGLFDIVEMWPEDHAKIDLYRSIGN